jgi:integrase/recombinase XerD
MTLSILPFTNTLGVEKWEAILERYLEECKYRGLTPSTLKNYSDYLSALFIWMDIFVPEAVELRNIRASHIKKYLAYKKESGLSDRSTKTHLVAIKTFFNWALDDESEEKDSDGDFITLVDTNPAARIKSVRIPQKLTRFLSEKQVEKLLASCDNRNFYGRRRKTIIYLLVSTGMRKFELTNIRIGDIDLNTHAVFVMGKGRKERTVPIAKGIREEFYKYLEVREKIMEKNKSKHDFLWISKLGTANNSVNFLNSEISIAQNRAGVRFDRACHIFRNTFAAWEKIKGTQDYKIMRIGGWSDNSMLLHYSEGLFNYEDHADNYALSAGPQGFYPSQC